MITMAHDLDAPMNVTQCKAAMNEMLHGTCLEAAIIAQRKQQGTYNPNQPLVGNKWWQGFSNRNKALVKKCVGKSLQEIEQNIALTMLFSRCTNVCLRLL
jgi:hypothetical protein